MCKNLTCKLNFKVFFSPIVVFLFKISRFFVKFVSIQYLFLIVAYTVTVHFCNQQVLLCFTRDSDVLYLFNHSASNPILTSLKGKPSSPEVMVAYPPSGVIPFHGFTMYGELISKIMHTQKWSRS